MTPTSNRKRRNKRAAPIGLGFDFSLVEAPPGSGLGGSPGVPQPDGPGFITVFPCGDVPLASNLNFVAGQEVPNAVLAPVSPTGTVCFYASATTHILADVSGWFATAT